MRLLKVNDIKKEYQKIINFSGNCFNRVAEYTFCRVKYKSGYISQSYVARICEGFYKICTFTPSRDILCTYLTTRN